MANINATATEILSGALALIQEHGYNTGLGREGDSYSIPAAFDEIVFGRPQAADQVLKVLLGEPPEFPDGYWEAREAVFMHFAEGEMEPKTKERAVAVLQAGLDYLEGRGAAGAAA